LHSNAEHREDGCSCSAFKEYSINIEIAQIRLAARNTVSIFTLFLLLDIFSAFTDSVPERGFELLKLKYRSFFVILKLKPFIKLKYKVCYNSLIILVIIS